MLLSEINNISQITQVITTVGFPIVMCGAMSWYVKYISDRHSKEVQQLNEQHQEEMKQVTEALNNNTLALQKLCDKIGGEE